MSPISPVVNTELGEIQVAVVDEEPDAAAEAAGRLRDILAGARAPWADGGAAQIVSLRC